MKRKTKKIKVAPNKMQLNKGYKYQIYPNKEQQVLIAKTFGCARFIYNRMLSDKQAYYKLLKTTLNTTPAQYKSEFAFLKEVDSLALANAQLNLDGAYSRFFKKIGGFPTFKKKKSGGSYTTNVVNGNIALLGDALKLPKLGYVKIKLHRELPIGSAIKGVTISQTSAGKYYASILISYEVDKPNLADISESKTLGLDYSSPSFYIDSEGNKANYGKYFSVSESKLAKAQRILSKKKKGSANYYKQKQKVAVVHEKITRQRLDFLHKQSYSIAKNYNVVVVEDLNLQGLSGTLKLGKATHDNGFGMFRVFLKYKLEDRGKHFVVIDKWYPSSKTCGTCGHIHKELKLKDRVHKCPSCNTESDRDFNAAINIKREGLRMLISA